MGQKDGEKCAAAAASQPTPLLPRRLLALGGWPWRDHRVSVALRAVAALGGGYLLASAVAAACALTLPLPNSEAVLAGTMLAYLVYALAVMACFYCRRTWQAFAWTLLPAAMLGLWVMARIG